MTAWRCSAKASRASSNTRRARMYTGSSSPGIFVALHPAEQLLSLGGAAPWARQEVGRHLGERRVDDPITLLAAVIHHGAERLGQDHVRARHPRPPPPPPGRPRPGVPQIAGGPR